MAGGTWDKGASVKDLKNKLFLKWPKETQPKISKFRKQYVYDIMIYNIPMNVLFNQV